LSRDPEAVEAVSTIASSMSEDAAAAAMAEDVAVLLEVLARILA
jgi:hypothetical protein